MYIYSIPRFGSSLLLGIVGISLADLYIYGFGLPPFWGLFPIVMGYLAIAFSQFFFGWISDKWYTRWGRRKPWIILLAPLSFLSFICLYVPTFFLKNPSQVILITWLIAWDVAFEFAYAVSTPYGAWMAEEFTMDERPKCSQIQNVLSYIGYGTTMVFSFFVLTDFTKQLKSNPGVLPSIYPVYVWACIIFGIIFLGSYYLSAFLMPTEDPPKIKPDLRKNLKDIAHNKNYLVVVLMQGFASLTWITVTGMMLLYMQTVLGFGEIEFIIAGLTLLFGIFIFLAMWRKLVTKWGKKKTLLTIFLLAACVISCSLFGLVSFSSTLVFGILFILGIAASLGGWFLLSTIWYADLAEDDAQKTGEMKAGLYGGFPSIALNLFQALGTFILAELVTLPNYTANGQTFSLGYVVWGPIFAGCLVLTYLFTRRFVKLDVGKQKSSSEESMKEGS